MSSLVTKRELFSTDRTVTSSSPGETPVSQLTSLTCEHPLFIFACANFSYLHACVYTHTHAHIHHTRGHTRTRINTFPRPNIFLVFSIFRPLQQSSQKKELQGASRGRISPCQRPPLPALPPVYTRMYQYMRMYQYTRMCDRRMRMCDRRMRMCEYTHKGCRCQRCHLYIRVCVMDVCVCVSIRPVKGCRCQRCHLYIRVTPWQEMSLYTYMRSLYTCMTSLYTCMLTYTRVCWRKHACMSCINVYVWCLNAYVWRIHVMHIRVHTLDERNESFYDCKYDICVWWCDIVCMMMWHSMYVLYIYTRTHLRWAEWVLLWL